MFGFIGNLLIPMTSLELKNSNFNVVLWELIPVWLFPKPRYELIYFLIRGIYIYLWPHWRSMYVSTYYGSRIKYPEKLLTFSFVLTSETVGWRWEEKRKNGETPTQIVPRTWLQTISRNYKQKGEEVLTPKADNLFCSRNMFFTHRVPNYFAWRHWWSKKMVSWTVTFWIVR